MEYSLWFLTYSLSEIVCIVNHFVRLGGRAALEAGVRIGLFLSLGGGTKEELGMPAVFINCAVILLGGALGLLLKSRLPRRLLEALMEAMGLCVVVIGAAGAIATGNMLCVLVCMVAGTGVGALINIEKRLDSLGEALRRRVEKGGAGESGFTQSFVTATLMFCVGAMALVGSLQAGLGDWSVLLSKSVIDGVTAVSLAATLGAGVLFAAVPVLLYQGAVVLLSGALAGVLEEAVITELSAVGGVMILALGLNMLGLRQKPLQVGNMLPAILLPPLYLLLLGNLA